VWIWILSNFQTNFHNRKKIYYCLDRISLYCNISLFNYSCFGALNEKYSIQLKNNRSKDTTCWNLEAFIDWNMQTEANDSILRHWDYATKTYIWNRLVLNSYNIWPAVFLPVSIYCRYGAILAAILLNKWNGDEYNTLEKLIRYKFKVNSVR
jgi:hypothetical protein